MDWLVAFDYDKYLLNDDEVRLIREHNFPGKANKTSVTELQHVIEGFAPKAVLRYTEAGIPYASLEQDIAPFPTWEAWCKEGENHREEKQGDRTVYLRDITVFFWTLSFDTLEDLEQFLIKYDPALGKVIDEKIFGPGKRPVLRVGLIEDFKKAERRKKASQLSFGWQLSNESL